MFDTPQFWGALGATAALSWLLPAERVRTRALLICVASVLVVLGVVGLKPALLGLVFAATAWTVLGLRLTSGLAQKRPLLAAFCVLLPILLLWVAGKQAVGQALEGTAAHLKVLYFVGFSYFLVKAWTLIKDMHDGRVKAPDNVVILAYFLFFPTYVSGPMHLYGEFDKTLRDPKAPDAEGLVDTVFRILLGLAKVKVLAPLLMPLSLEAVKQAGGASPLQLAVACVVYSIVIWADFSGYSDLAIATSKLMGMETPENFKRPYAAPNPREFWQRWHMTFSRILTSYVFIPISRGLQPKLRSKPKAVMIIATLGTFLFCGYWHGPTMNFLVWGAWHALGLIVYDLYRPGAMKRRMARKKAGTLPSPMMQRLTHGAAVAATFVFVSVGWSFFVLPLSHLFGGGA